MHWGARVRSGGLVLRLAWATGLLALSWLLGSLLLNGWPPWPLNAPAAAPFLAGGLPDGLLLGLALNPREAEQQLDRLLHRCPVTGLPNRSALLQILAARVQQLRRDGGDLAVVALTIDQHERISHALGLEQADAALQAAARQLSAALPEDGLLAHLGDGEFAALLPGRPALSEAHALGQAEDLCAALARPIALGDTELQLSCALGLTLSPRDGERPQQLLQQARAALARAQRAAGLRVRAYTAATQEQEAARLTLEAALRRAACNGELSLHFQPILDLQTGHILAAEALLRWQHPQRGAVSPAEFIPIAEESGLIVEIGQWVLRQACLQNLAWQRAGLRPIRVSVNLSGRQLYQPDIAWRIQTILMESGLDPKYLSLEITESVLVDESSHVARVLNSLRAIGIELVLDDFGTGYSNLSYLRHLPITVLKLDRSIVHDIAATDQQVSMSRAVINLAHELKLKILAEGVETEGQLALLLAHRCDQMQGHCFSPAVPAPALAELLADGRRLSEQLLRPPLERTLLLVDDEENILAALKRLLRRDGYRILTASSGTQGLQRLAEAEVDVILSDQRMPGMTGVEFLRRAKDLCPDSVRMVLSGYTELQSITDAINEGAIYKFLTKPWDDERLRSHVAEAFRSKEMADENKRLAGAVKLANQELAALNQRLERLLQKQGQKLSQEETSLQLARTVLETIPVALLGIDRSGLLVYSNRAADLLFGADAQAGSLLGQDAEQVLPAPLLELWRGRDLAVRHFERLGQRYQASCRPLLDPQAQPRGHLLVLTPQLEADRESPNHAHAVLRT